MEAALRVNKGCPNPTIESASQEAEEMYRVESELESPFQKADLPSIRGGDWNWKKGFKR